MNNNLSEIENKNINDLEELYELDSSDDENKADLKIKNWQKNHGTTELSFFDKWAGIS